MSNRPTTLNDLRNRQGAQQRSVPARGRVAGGSRGLFGGMEQHESKPPRRENYCDMWQTALCPNFKLCSFTFFNVMLQIFVYLGTLAHTSTSVFGLNQFIFLGNSPFVLEMWGMRMPYYIRVEGQIWRLVTSLYLNYGISSLLVSCVFQLVIGSIVEKQIGALGMGFYFIVVGSLANLFGATVSPLLAVGAEPTVIAYVTAMIAMYTFYWPSIAHEDQFCRKCMGLFFLILLLVVSVMFVLQFAQLTGPKFLTIAQMAYPDLYGDLGALLFGISLTWALLPPVDGRQTKFSRRQSQEKWLFVIGLITFFALTASIILAFGFGEPPIQIWTPRHRDALERLLTPVDNE